MTPQPSVRTTAAGPALAAQSNPSVEGAWSSLFPLNSPTNNPPGGIIAIDTNLLPNGKVLIFTRQAPDGNDNLSGHSWTYVWDPATESVIRLPVQLHAERLL